MLEGRVTSYVYWKGNEIIFNDLARGYSDPYHNNQFEGRWTDHRTGRSKKCNWALIVFRTRQTLMTMQEDLSDRKICKKRRLGNIRTHVAVCNTRKTGHTNEERPDEMVIDLRREQIRISV